MQRGIYERPHVINYFFRYRDQPNVIVNIHVDFFFIRANNVVVYVRKVCVFLQTSFAILYQHCFEEINLKGISQGATLDFTSVTFIRSPLT